MTQAKNGDHVEVHYTGKLNDGTVFDSSADGDPLSFTLGEGKIIEGFEDAIRGMKTGDKKTVMIPPDKGYGLRNDEMVIDVPLNQLPKDLNPQEGQQLQLTNQDNQPIVVVITKVTEESITLDGNPPLAGRDLTFDLELVTIA
ncbi:MAG: peptidylprolyl isomerase [Desulfobacterales bacterium]|nr:peptidylprolyl isomerase [Deltaproteobacteria bacterium]NNK93558.1 peptidylprolyl isomerase [Desulfobacterales bacterium]